MYFTEIDIKLGSVLAIGVAGDHVFVGGSSGTLVRFSRNSKATIVTAPAVGNIASIAGGQNDRVIVAVQNIGIYYSDDFGSSWTQSSSNTSLSYVASDGAGNVVASSFTNDQGALSTDNGATFGGAVDQGTGSTQSLKWHADAGLFVRTASSVRVNTSADGSTWNDYNLSGTSSVNFLAQGYFNSAFYFGNSNGEIYKSTDNGQTATLVDKNFFNDEIGLTTVTFQCKDIVSRGDGVYCARGPAIDMSSDGSSFSPIPIGAAKSSLATLDSIIEYDGFFWVISSNRIFRETRSSEFLDGPLDTITAINLNYTGSSTSIETNGGKIYVGLTSARAIVFDTVNTSASLKSTPGTASVYGMAIGSSGRVIYAQGDGIYTTDDDFDNSTLRESGSGLRVVASDGAGTVLVTNTASATGERSTDNGDTFTATAFGSGTTSIETPQVLMWHNELSLFVRFAAQTVNTSADGSSWTSTDHSATLSTRNLVAQEYHDGKLWFGDDNGRLYTSEDNGVTITEFDNTFFNEQISSSPSNFTYGMLFSMEDRLFSGHGASSLCSMKTTETAFIPVGISSPTFEAESTFLDAVKVGNKMYFVNSSNLLFNTLDRSS